jgi:magnesium-transporting ATPase (P-type)
MNVLEALGVVSLCLYGLLGVACVISFVLSCKKRNDVDPAQAKLQQLYHLFLGLFVVVRLVWVALHSFSGSTVVSFVLNRCGFVLFFTAFTIVLFYWAELYHKNYIVAKGFLPRLFNTFVIINALLYSIEIIVVLLFLIVDRAEYSHREGNPIYETSVYLEIFVSFTVSIAFMIYGVRLFLQHGRAHDFEENYSRKAREILVILVATIIFTVCFILRVVAFLYRPITGEYMPQELFQVLAYYIPEVIPSLVQFYLIRRKDRKEKKDTRFVHDLYQMEEDVLKDDMTLQKSVSPNLTPRNVEEGGRSKTEKSPLMTY